MWITFPLLLAVLTRAIGDFRDPIYALITAVLLAFFWRDCPGVPQWNRAINWVFRWSTWALALGMIRAADPPLSLAFATAAAWLFVRFGPEEKRAGHQPLVVMGMLYMLWWTALFQLPELYNVITRWSMAYTPIVTAGLERSLILGPSASALDLLVLGVAGVIVLTLMSAVRRWAYAAISVILLEAGRIIYLWFAPILYGIVSKATPVSNTPHLDMPGLYLLFVVGVLWLYQRSCESEPATGSAAPSARRPAGRSPLMVTAFVAVILAFVIGGAASYNSGPVRVLFLDKGTLDSSVPNFQRFGDRSGGMFGFLPRYLHESGYELHRRDITPGLLDSVDVVIIANLLKKLPVGQKHELQGWVENGGGLLILADHTGTDAIRDPTNDILEPTGMSLNFDTAVPLRRSWVSAKNYLFHPLGRSGGVMDGELWLGASVDPGPHGEPFLVGRGAFSDPGDLRNKDRAFLGNLAYDPGEPIGDITLAAAVHWGKGRAILHGDTSPYQNGTIVRSHTLINRSLRWLANTGWGSFIDRWRGWLLAVLIMGVGTFLATAAIRSPVLLAMALLLPLVSVSFWSAIPGPRGQSWRGDEYQLALIDNGNGQMFDGMSWEDKSVGGLEFNLMRNGYAMYFADSPAELGFYNPDLYVLFAPTRPLAQTAIEQIEDFVHDGGWVIVSTGWNLAANVQPLFERFGLSIQNVPLGAVSGVAFGDSVKMADAYPVGSEDMQAEDLITCFGFPVAKAVRRGEGGIVVIGDSQFFYNINIEGQEGHVVMENIAFIREMLKRTAGSTAL